MLKNRHQHATVEYDISLESADEELNPENQMLRMADRELVYRLIDQLPEKQRQAVTMRYIRDMSLQQVADELGCSISSVTRYLERARDNLEQELLKEV